MLRTHEAQLLISLVAIGVKKKPFPTIFTNLAIWLVLLEAWLVLTSINYHRNVSVSIPLNQWLALTMLRATSP